jgi:MerR family glutamine synthetase transcriptional repressor
MAEKELRRNMAVLPIGTVRKLTYLTDRQIRYYEAQGLITPARTASNQRMYSLNDIDRLLEIKDYLLVGDSIANIKRIYAKQAQRESDNISAHQARQALQSEFLNLVGFKVNQNRKGL